MDLWSSRILAPNHTRHLDLGSLWSSRILKSCNQGRISSMGGEHGGKRSPNDRTSVSQTKNGTNKHNKVHREKPRRPQPCTKKHRQLRNAGKGRGGLPHGEAHQLVVWCQKASPQITHGGSTIQTEQVLYLGIYIYVYAMHKHICMQ